MGEPVPESAAGLSPNDPAFQPPAAPKSAIAGFGEKLRGFEIIGVEPWGAERLFAKYRPTELAARQAAADLKWLQWRHPESKYELRALLSIGRDAPPPPETDAAPLHLDADEPEVVAEPDPAAAE